MKSAEYQQGRLDGLREAIDIMRGLEAHVADQLAQPSRVPTRNARRVRCQAYKNGAQRITTRLNRLQAKATSSRSAVEVGLARLGL